MKIDVMYLFVVHLITGIIFGLGFILLPETILELIALSTTGDILIMGRVYGSSILGIAVLNLLILYKREEPSTLRGNIMLTYMATFLLLNILLLMYLDLSNLMVLSIILLHLAFIVAYGFFYYKELQQI